LVFGIFVSTTLWILEPIWPFRTSTLRRATPNLRVHVERPHWIIPALTEYLLVYLPFFLLWICALLTAITNWQPPALIWLSILIACLGAGFAGASTLFYYLTARPVQIEKSAAEASSEAARWPKTTHLPVLAVAGFRRLFLIAESLSRWHRCFHESLVFAAQGCLQSVATLLLLTPYISVMSALGQWQDPRGIALLIVILIVHFFCKYRADRPR
jgi:hypothetical protein